MNNSSKLKKIAINSGFLYIRMFFNLFIGLYTSRLLIDYLGINDYGVYNVVASFITIFTFLINPFSDASSRFLSFELGKKDLNKLKLIFSSSLTIHLFFSFIILIFLTIFSFVFFDKLNIPTESIYSAKIILMLTIVSLLFKIMIIPFRAVIVANERLKLFAYLSVFETSLKLCLVYTIQFNFFDKLIYYALIILSISVIIFFIHLIYCIHNFNECSLKLSNNKKVLKTMSSFAGWNLLGTSTFVLNNQGINLIINNFHGVLLNASFSISNQVLNSIKNFVTNVMTAIRPQIIMSYSSNDFEFMKSLVFSGAKYSFFLMFVVITPFIFYSNEILSLWLVKVPPYSSSFVVLSLLSSLIGVYSRTIRTAVMATGNIKNYYIYVGCISLLNLPLSYLFLYYGYEPYFVFISYMLIEITALSIRIHFMSKLIPQLEVKSFLINVIAKTIYVFLISILLNYAISCLISFSFISLLIFALSSLIINSIVIFFFGLNIKERNIIIKKTRTLIYKNA